MHQAYIIMPDKQTKPDWLESHIHLEQIGDTQNWVFYPFDIKDEEILRLSEKYENYGYKIIRANKSTSEYKSKYTKAHKILILKNEHEENNFEREMEQIKIKFEKEFINEEEEIKKIENQLESIQPKAIEPYLGSIQNLYDNSRHDRLAQFAYTLRETIDLLCRANQSDNERSNTRSLKSPKRLKLLEKVLYPHIISAEQQGNCLKLIEYYRELNTYAHHVEKITQEVAEQIHYCVQCILVEITKQSISFVGDVDDIIKQQPSHENAVKLRSIINSPELYNYALNNMDPSWFMHLYNANYFWKYDTIIDYYNITYLIKCTDVHSDMITKCILDYEDHTDNDAYQVIYWKLIHCTKLLPIEQSLKIIEKIIKENWSKYGHTMNMCNEYIELALKLYRDQKYNKAMQLLQLLISLLNMKDIKIQENKLYASNEMLKFIDKKPNDIISAFKHAFIVTFEKYNANNKFINELFLFSDQKIDPKLLDNEFDKFDYRSIIKLLKREQEILSDNLSHDQKYAQNNNLKYAIEENLPEFIDHNSYEIIEVLVKLIIYTKNDYDYNILPQNFSQFCIINCQNCIRNIDSDDASKLDKIIELLQDANTEECNNLKYYTYQTHKTYFQALIPKILVEQFYSDEKLSGYKELFHTEFEQLNEPIKFKILTLIDGYCEQKYKERKDDISKIKFEEINNRYLYVMLKPIFQYLTGDWRKKYKSLLDKNIILQEDYTKVEKTLDPKPTNEFEFMSVIDVFNKIKKHTPSSFPNIYDQTISTFQEYIKKNHQKCWSHLSLLDNANESVLYAFLNGIDEVIRNDEVVDWSEFFNFVIKLSKKDVKGPIHNIIKESCWIIDYALENNKINKNMDKILFNTIICLIKSKDVINGDKEFEKHIDTLNTSRNNSNGLSYHILLEYESWSRRNFNDKDLFHNKIKPIIDDYIKCQEIHTISRHAVLGLFFNVLAYHDENWARESIKKLFKSRNTKIAFWDSYILNNLTRWNMKNLNELYGEFLNGAILNDYRCTRIYTRTISHVTLGYLHSLENCEQMLMKFISHAKENSISIVCDTIKDVLKGNENSAQFDDKIEKLWVNERVIKYGHLEILFDLSNFDKKISINLLAKYLEKSNKPINYIKDTLVKLEKYIDIDAEKVLLCMKYLVSKTNYLPYNEIKKLLKNKKLPTDANNIHYKNLMNILMKENISYLDVVKKNSDM